MLPSMNRSYSMPSLPALGVVNLSPNNTQTFARLTRAYSLPEGAYESESEDLSHIQEVHMEMQFSYGGAQPVQEIFPAKQTFKDSQYSNGFDAPANEHIGLRRGLKKICHKVGDLVKGGQSLDRPPKSL